MTYTNSKHLLNNQYLGKLLKVAKVLANRLKKVMSRLVNKAQNAFVEGREIVDASLIANKVINSMVRKKEKGVLCKLDVEKAYDKLNWKFPLSVLKEMGFGSKCVTFQYRIGEKLPDTI